MKSKLGIILAAAAICISLFVYFHTYTFDTMINNIKAISPIYNPIFSFHRNGKQTPTTEMKKEWKNCELEISNSKKDECKRDRFMNHTVISVLIDWKHDVGALKKHLLPSIQYLKPMDIILFSDSEPNSTVQVDIRKASHHKFRFVKTTFTFPEGFDYIKTKSPFSKRSKWGYIHMIRFWFKNIWLEPALKPYKYILRFDTDSCLVGKKFSFPTNEDLVYLWINFRYEVFFITNLKSTILNYVKTRKITVKNKKMFEFYKQPNVAQYYNNMEIVSIAFMNRPEVKDFINYIDSSYGQYKYRWGDAPLRYATLALFAEENSVQALSVGLNQGYRHPC